MMRRQIMAVAAVSATALALAGCAAPADDAAEDGPTTLTFWHGYTEADGDVLDQIVDDFNESQDDYVIKTETKTWAVIDDTLLPALSSDEGPDIVAMPAERMPVYADRGAFVDLSDFYASKDSNTSELVDQSVDMVTVDGTPYGVPTGFVPLSVFYNKALFTAAGIDRFPTTWDEWVDAAKTLTVDEDGDGTPEQYGLALPDHATVANGLWPSLLLSGGGSIVDGATDAVIDSSENADSIAYWVDAITNDKISPTGLDGIGADELFSSGKAAMHVGGPWMSFIAADNDIDYGIAAIPAGPEQQAASAIGVSMGITEQADDAQVAGAEAVLLLLLPGGHRHRMVARVWVAAAAHGHPAGFGRVEPGRRVAHRDRTDRPGAPAGSRQQRRRAHSHRHPHPEGRCRRRHRRTARCRAERDPASHQVTELVRGAPTSPLSRPSSRRERRCRRTPQRRPPGATTVPQPNSAGERHSVAATGIA